MYIHEIEIRNFKTIRKAILENIGQINILVGANDSGKSNILDVIRCFFQELACKKESNCLENASKLHDLVWPRIDLNRRINIRAKASIPREAIICDKGPLLVGVLVGLFPSPHLDIIIERELSGKDRIWHTKNFSVNDKRIIADGMYGNSTGLADKLVFEIIENVFLYCQNQISWIELHSVPKSKINFIGQKEPIVSSEILNDILSWHSDLTKQNRKRIHDLKDLFSKFTGGSSLQQDGTLLRIIEKGFEPPIGSVGSGKQQLLQLSYEVLHGNRVVLLEEPETHFHPRLIRQAFKVLRNFCIVNNIQLFMTTHSPVFLDQANILDIWMVRRSLATKKKRGGTTKCERLANDEDLLRIVDELGLLPSDASMTNTLFFVEGPSDQIVLSKWCQVLGLPLRCPSVQVVLIGGKNGEKHKADTWIPVVKALRGMKMIWLFDSDLNDRAKDDLEIAVGGKNQVLRLDAGSIEDYYNQDWLKEALLDTVEMSEGQKNQILSLNSPGVVTQIDRILGKNTGWKVPVARIIAATTKSSDDLTEPAQTMVKGIIDFIERALLG